MKHEDLIAKINFYISGIDIHKYAELQGKNYYETALELVNDRIYTLEKKLSTMKCLRSELQKKTSV